MNSVQGNTITFTTDFFVVDSNSTLLPLTGNQVLIEGFDSQGTTFSFQQTDFDLFQQAFVGPYSALFMLDQSASISSTDPGDARLTATKVFLDNLEAGDEVGLAAFASGGALPFSPVKVYRSNGQRYTANVGGFVPSVNGLAVQEGGSTPLYDAAIIGVNDLANLGRNSNKAMRLFSDGEDTGVLTRMAFETGAS